MQSDSPLAQFVRRLDGHHIMPQSRKSGRIAPCAGANVQNPAWNRRDQMKKLPMCVSKGNALISFDQRIRLLGVSLRAAHPNRHPSPEADRLARKGWGATVVSAKVGDKCLGRRSP